MFVMVKNLSPRPASILVPLFVLGCILAASAGSPAPSDDGVFWLRAPLPLGNEEYKLKSIKRDFYIMASLENASMDGVRVDRKQGRVFQSDGTPMRTYPPVLEFRVSASGLDHRILLGKGFQVDSGKDLNSYLLNLRFQLKVFHGLNKRELKPLSVRVIGVPADLPYDERIYRVAFELPDVPVEDRVVLNVLSPEGECLSKFHLELL
jgi:hypothetical protein